MLKSVPFEPHIHCALRRFVSAKMKDKIAAQRKLCAITEPKHEEALFSQSRSADNGGTTGITLETLQCRRKGTLLMEEVKKVEREIDRSQGTTRVTAGNCSMESAPVLCQSLLNRWHVFISYHWDLKSFRIGIFLIPKWISNKTCRLVNTTSCFTLTFHYTEIRVYGETGILLLSF